MDTTVVNAHVIYKKTVDSKMNLFKFKVTLAESLINRFSSRKRKFMAEEPDLTVQIPQSMKEPDHMVQFTDKRRRCQYCLNNGRKEVKCFTYCQSCNVFLCVQKDRNCFKLFHTY